MEDAAAAKIASTELFIRGRAVQVSTGSRDVYSATQKGVSAACTFVGRLVGDNVNIGTARRLLVEVDRLSPAKEVRWCVFASARANNTDPSSVNASQSPTQHGIRGRKCYAQ